VTQTSGSFGTDSNGLNYANFDGDTCTCTCSGGANPRGCSYLQIAFCVNSCKRFGLPYRSCEPNSLMWNDAVNCRCASK